jgi:hypothetical protein
MTPWAPEAGLRPFSQSGYEILDEDLIATGEVVIWSVDPLPPRIGDLFLVQSRGATHEVQVAALKLVKGGWSALCRIYGLVRT